MRKPITSSFLLLLLYRFSSVFVIQTSYVPDEFWQSLEVAHNIVFGYGYLTWEWKHGLRSYLYPSCFAVVYKILQFLNIDIAYLIIIVPRLLQALLVAVSDQYFLFLCKTFGFDNYWAKIYIFTNWFWYYCGCRTITNTFETCLTVIALYYYPWNLFMNKVNEKKNSFHETKAKSVTYLALSVVNCIVRPTAVTIWGPLVIFHLCSVPLKYLKEFFLGCILPVVLYVVFPSLVVDFLFYGKIIIPALNFFVFNIFKDVSSFYGTHSFHWYLSQGLPAVLGLHIFPFTLGFISLIRNLFTKTKTSLDKVFNMWIFIIVLNITILSYIPHKEFRFALPLIPLMMLIAVKETTDVIKSSKLYKHIWTILLTLSFIMPTILLGIFHQRGPLQLMNYLSSASVNCRRHCSFLFLMPCHSTPLYSHLHVNVTTRFLTCNPPLDDNFYDESDEFFKKPVEWLEKYWNDENPPSHISLFDSLEHSVDSFLKSKGFAKKQTFLHTIFAEKYSGKYIVVYEPS